LARIAATTDPRLARLHNTAAAMPAPMPVAAAGASLWRRFFINALLYRFKGG
jgi:hypothetical protein